MPQEETAQDISTVYRFLAQCMQYPDEQWTNDDFFAVLYNLLGTLGATDEGVEVKKAVDSSDDILEDLQVEYTRLFINGIPHVIAPPFASVYIDKALQGKLAGDTLAFYHDKGFGMEKTADLPDHLVHELEFLSLLTKEGDFAGEEEFLRRFFRPWYNLFLSRVIEGTNHPYYRVVVQLIDLFTKEEKEDGIQPNEA